MPLGALGCGNSLERIVRMSYTCQLEPRWDPRFMLGFFSARWTGNTVRRRAEIETGQGPSGRVGVCCHDS
jgi:hypothetical protein